MHHAFVIEGEAEEGIAVALGFAERELGMKVEGLSTGLGAGNPDIVVLQYGLFSVADARRVTDLAAGAAFAGEHRVIIIAAARAYHEAQNALLKVFEEPPAGTHLFLIFPTLGGLLPTLRSRVQVLTMHANLDIGCPSSELGHPMSHSIPEIAREFIMATKERRTAIAKKLASGKDDDERREHRDSAIALLNGIEAAVCESRTLTKNAALLSDIATLRGHLYDRSAPVKMILEHLSLVTPKTLL